MLFTVHLLAGAGIGYAVRNPAVALLGGVASHFILDSIPHWAVSLDHEQWLAIARIDGIVGILVVAAVIFMLPAGRRLAPCLGAIGAGLPDLNKPASELLGIKLYPAWLDDFHAKIQTEGLDLWAVDLGFGLLLAGGLAVAVVLGRKREKENTPGAGEPLEDGHLPANQGAA